MKKYVKENNSMNSDEYGFRLEKDICISTFYVLSIYSRHQTFRGVESQPKFCISVMLNVACTQGTLTIPDTWFHPFFGFSLQRTFETNNFIPKSLH